MEEPSPYLQALCCCSPRLLSELVPRVLWAGAEVVEEAQGLASQEVVEEVEGEEVAIAQHLEDLKCERSCI